MGTAVAGVYESVKVVRFRRELFYPVCLLIESIHDGMCKVRVARELLEQRVGYVETVLAYGGRTSEVIQRLKRFPEARRQESMRE